MDATPRHRIWYNQAVQRFHIFCAALLSASCVSFAVEENEGAAVPWYAGAGAGTFLPGGGSSLSRAAQAAVRAGWYVSDFLAFEVEGACAPNASSGTGHAAVTGLAARGLFHLSGWEAFGKLFGYERLDPFVTAGVQSFLSTRHAFADGSHRTAVGPSVGVGAFYYLTDSWALRFDATAAMSVDSPCGMNYGLAAGVQWSFGGGDL